MTDVDAGGMLEALRAVDRGVLAKEVVVGDTAVLLRELSRRAGSMEAVSVSAPTIMGIPVKTDFRVPEGVWVMRPAGSGLSDPDVQVGAISGEYVKVAKAFKFFLGSAREALGSAF